MQFHMYLLLQNAGDHKNELIWCVDQDSLIQSVRFVYPSYYKKKQTMERFSVSSNILYIDDVSLHDSPLWISRERGDEQRISKDQYLGLFSIVASRGIEYVNIYEVLNVVKK